MADFAGPEFRRFAATSGVETRHLALPLSRYRELSGFTEANDAYLDIALELGERALKSAFAQAEIEPSEVDVVFSTTVTGLAVPSLEARLATRLGFRPDVKRVPLFGLGCVAGAAGMARVHDYLRAFPSHVAALLAVELCSLTIQRDDHSLANLVASSLFGESSKRGELNAVELDVRIKRIYDAPEPSDGFRVLVDRLWPRGVKRAGAARCLGARAGTEHDVYASGFNTILNAGRVSGAISHATGR